MFHRIRSSYLLSSWISIRSNWVEVMPNYLRKISTVPLKRKNQKNNEIQKASLVHFLAGKGSIWLYPVQQERPRIWATITILKTRSKVRSFIWKFQLENSTNSIRRAQKLEFLHARARSGRAFESELTWPSTRHLQQKISRRTCKHWRQIQEQGLPIIEHESLIRFGGVFFWRI